MSGAQEANVRTNEERFFTETGPKTYTDFDDDIKKEKSHDQMLN
jgi:hypothetical protein